MNKNNVLTHALIGVLVVLLAAPVGVFAQTNEGNQNHTYSKAELDQMLANIALYPDSLLAQVLVAATYPEQVVEADRWVKANKDLSKDKLNAELDKKDWDLSVKALVPFPQVLAMMDEHLDWTTKLGEAFLAQQKDVMASIQGMREKAYAKGNLKTTEQQKVVVKGEDIEIEPANPEVVYVPYYDPMTVYGDWWWPGYLPYAFFPFWGPFFAWGPFGFGLGIGVGAYWGAGWGSWNWGGGYANLNRNRNVNINRNDPRITSNMRTANSSQLASRRAAGLGRTAGALGAGRTGVGGRPSVASVQRSLSRGRAGLSRGGFAHNGASHAGGNVARGGFTHNGVSHATGNVARGGFGHGSSFARGGHFGGGFARGGFSHFGGGGFGGAHFGGGGFGGGHFGGGGFGGGHFGGGGGHGGGRR
jgi:hypothetical protein